MSVASVAAHPTHYAVALEFSFETMQAPVLLAKGRDLFAAEIREEAGGRVVPTSRTSTCEKSVQDG